MLVSWPAVRDLSTATPGQIPLDSPDPQPIHTAGEHCLAFSRIASDPEETIALIVLPLLKLLVV